MINLLLKRGQALSHGIVWEQIKYEMELKKHILDNKEVLIRPHEAYITFKTEESF